MSNFPDFDRHGYQVIEQLGQNYQGGRFTYKAIDLKSKQPVVIKQFKFLTSSDWSGYKTIEREISVLQGLNHPGIPRYLDSFDPGDGLCLVQEYKNAQPLSVPRSYSPEEIKQIAVAVLEILVYLQQRIPPLIHRDIKPENVLADDRLNVYLVDFGFAKMGRGEVVAPSSMVAGTLGFMPPEQLFNRPLTEASDLYGLGATLICLLTGTKSTELGNLIDSSFRINFKPLVTQLSIRFIEWLERMVQPNFQDRFENAKAALSALQPLDVIRLPEVKLSHSTLEFEATKLGEILTQTLTVSNPIPETVLEGSWEVIPHPNDPLPAPESQPWISLSPARFASNSAQCKIAVDTSKLMAAQVYQRQIVLRTNSSPQTQTLTVKVQTAQIPIETRKLPSVALALWFAIFSAGTGMIAVAGTEALVGALIGILLGAVLGVGLGPGKKAVTEALVGALVGGLVGAVLAAGAIAGKVFGVGMWLGALVGLALVSVALAVAVELISTAGERRFNLCFATVLSLLAAANGISLGVGFTLGFTDPLFLVAVIGTNLPLVCILGYPPLNQRRLIAKYRASEQEQHLIKP